MVLFFGLQKLETQAQCSDTRFMQILEDFYNSKELGRPTLSGLKYKSITGTSYLLNAKPLFKQPVDVAYVVQYIKLAARRDYLLFDMFKQISLDLSYFPEINVSTLARNPLLNIQNNHIKFKFEEIYYGAKFR